MAVCFQSIVQTYSLYVKKKPGAGAMEEKLSQKF